MVCAAMLRSGAEGKEGGATFAAKTDDGGGRIPEVATDTGPEDSFEPKAKRKVFK